MSIFTRRRLLGLAAITPLAMATAARAATHEIRIKGFAFSPATLDVAAGDTVIFINDDNAPHTGTAGDGSFDTGRLNPNESGEVTIPAGEHEYICEFHRNMKGVIRAS